jgi:hypothetical protein
VHELARGTSITASARNMGVLPPTMLQLFAIGEESGSLEELMREISVHYQAEVDYADQAPVGHAGADPDLVPGHRRAGARPRCVHADVGPGPRHRR